VKKIDVFATRKLNACSKGGRLLCYMDGGDTSTRSCARILKYKVICVAVFHCKRAVLHVIHVNTPDEHLVPDGIESMV
jgi:hypothetical protein